MVGCWVREGGRVVCLLGSLLGFVGVCRMSELVGVCWSPLEDVGICRNLSVSVGVCWSTSVGDCWRMLEIVGESRRMSENFVDFARYD
jgi:hypothetical protein